MLAVCPCRARHKVKQSLEVSIEPQRQFFGLLLFDLSPDVCAVCLQNREFASDYYCLLRRPGVQDEVYTCVRVHKNIRTSVDGFLESLSFSRDFIMAWSEVGHFIVAAFVGRDRMNNAGLHFGDRDLRSRYNTAACVRRRSQQRCIDCLSRDWRRKPQDYCPRQYYANAQVPQFSETGRGRPCKFFGIPRRERIPAMQPRERRSKQFFHDITPSIRKDSSPGTSENSRYAWNWFHTLSKRKPHVKSESRGTNGLHRFSKFLPRGMPQIC